MALVELDDLHIELPGPGGALPVLRGARLTLGRGQSLGLVGESGSGKTMTALALMGLLPEGARVAGRLAFDGADLARIGEDAMADLRGRRIGMIFQEPMTALNPLHPVGRQVGEPLVVHRGLSRKEADSAAIALLERVGVTDARSRLGAFPHQLSGGQRQRVVIAMALACGPDLVIADEPTTALDVTVQAQVLDLLADVVRDNGSALLLISHDLAVVAGNVDRVAVMYAGRIVEAGPARLVLERPAHPYTQALLAARPHAGMKRRARLAAIPGSPPDPSHIVAGCAFAARCPRAAPDCRIAEPVLRDLHDHREVACLHPLRIAPA